MIATSTYTADRYTPKTLARARRAMRCAPFSLRLYEELQERGVPLATIAGHAGVNNGFTQVAIAELPAEDELLWLSVVGILRREVDGQGITDSFRLTPLGRILVAEWREVGALWVSRLSWIDRLRNWARRWLRLPY
jgi:hypothetical protein